MINTIKKIFQKKIFVYVNKFILERESIDRQIISNFKKVFYLSQRIKPNYKEKEILKRLKYFIPSVQIEIIRNIKYLPRHLRFPLLVESDLNLEYLHKNHSLYYFGSYNVDYEKNPFEGWEWHRLLADLDLDYLDELLQLSKNRFIDFVKKIKQKRKQKVYIFGTGPSVSKAINRDFSDGYVIVCNTIVKDKKLFYHLNPDFIVATDAIFHFDNNKYANHFRSDLAMRLSENKKTRLFFGNIFFPMALRSFFEFKERLIGIKFNEKVFYNDNLIKNYFLPNHGNVLTLALLPLAATLSNNINLWGFDGRSQNDKLFWKHSVNHSYEKEIIDIYKKHPAFFDYQVPKSNPFKYINKYFKETLENNLQQYEKNGFKITMMHDSYTVPLKKRFINKT